METSKLWDSSTEEEWQKHLERYWTFVDRKHLAIEKEFDSFDVNTLTKMDKDEWFAFLRDKYFFWKFTAPNRYATTTRHLKKYLGPDDNIDKLFQIKNALIELDKTDIKLGLKTAQRIRGLGPAGASGLLAVMYPSHFATVDQFVVKALSTVNRLPEKEKIKNMNPDNLKLTDGVLLVEIMRRKAAELNNKFSSNTWTPRKVDMVLWVSSR